MFEELIKNLPVLEVVQDPTALYEVELAQAQARQALHTALGGLEESFTLF